LPSALPSTPTCTSHTLHSLLLLHSQPSYHSLFLSPLSPCLRLSPVRFHQAISHSPSPRLRSLLSPHPLSCTPPSPPDTPHPMAHPLLLPSISLASLSPSLSLSSYSAPPAPLLLLPSSLSNSLTDYSASPSPRS